jgi:hypothetical protein
MSGDTLADELEALADELVLEHAAFFAVNPHAGVVPRCLIFVPGGDMVAVDCGWNTADERRTTLRALRLFLASVGATRYAIWSEIWAVVAPTPPGKSREEVERAFGENYEHGDLAADPERMECVFTLVVDASGLTANRLQKIVRGKGGKVVALYPMPIQAGLGGALASLLPARHLH